MEIRVESILRYMEGLLKEYRASCAECGDTSAVAEEIFTQLVALHDMILELTGCRVVLMDGKYVLVNGKEVVA